MRGSGVDISMWFFHVHAREVSHPLLMAATLRCGSSARALFHKPISTTTAEAMAESVQRVKNVVVTSKKRMQMMPPRPMTLVTRSHTTAGWNTLNTALSLSSQSRLRGPIPGSSGGMTATRGAPVWASDGSRCSRVTRVWLHGRGRGGRRCRPSVRIGRSSAVGDSTRDRHRRFLHVSGPLPSV